MGKEDEIVLTAEGVAIVLLNVEVMEIADVKKE